MMDLKTCGPVKIATHERTFQTCGSLDNKSVMWKMWKMEPMKLAKFWTQGHYVPDIGTRGCVDTEMWPWGQGDMGTGGHVHTGIWRQGHVAMGTLGHNMRTWGQGDMGTLGHVHTGTWGQGNVALGKLGHNMS